MAERDVLGARAADRLIGEGPGARRGVERQDQRPGPEQRDVVEPITVDVGDQRGELVFVPTGVPAV